MINRFLRRGPDVDEAVARLARYNYDPELLTRLSTYLQTTPSPSLDHVEPAELERALGLGEQATLEVLVAAVHEGLFDLYWSAHCAHCGDQNQEWAHLTQARPQTYCAGCQAHTDTVVDRTLRVRFALNSRYRAGGSVPPAAPPANPAPAEQLSGLDLLNVQAFHDLLVDEILPVNESLLVTHVSLLFSDLRGSTALYAQKGDPIAYSLVREHYGLVRRHVNAQRGAVVKTVGDGVMASFGDPAAGVRAALAIQGDLAGFNADHGLQGPDALRLKLGLHTGPCLSVNLNGRMDYFGTAVNIASRVEGLADGGDLVVTTAVVRESAARAVIDEARQQGAQIDEFTATLRGIDEPVGVLRITPAAVPAAALIGG
ncbi:MAG TPA: adenylate/guanylate cyclase domain-containing protein [Chloroflexia bacterium]|nr:adenylate/guanylate cyclase domain-containing protein [Chloroflexia bacterium]